MKYDGQGPTAQMWAEVFKSPSAGGLKNAGEIGLQPFPDYLRALCAARGERPEQVIRRADVERSFGHQIFKGTRRASRDNVIRLAFGFGLDLEGAQALLRHAGCGPLYPRVLRDAAIGFCLENGAPLMDCLEALLELGVPLLGERDS